MPAGGVYPVRRPLAARRKQASAVEQVHEEARVEDANLNDLSPFERLEHRLGAPALVFTSKSHQISVLKPPTGGTSPLTFTITDWTR